MIAKERKKSETIKLQRLQRTHSIELIHAMTVMYEGSITRNILRLEFLSSASCGLLVTVEALSSS